MALTLPFLETWLSGKLVRAMSILDASASDKTGTQVHIMAGSGVPSGRFTGAAATDICLYFQDDAASQEDVLWVLLPSSSTWGKYSTLSDLQLAPVSDVTVSAGGVATLTGATHTVRGAGGLADDVDTISGMTAAELSLLVTGAEAITYRDASVGGGNISTVRDASIVTATGDVVLAFLSGTVVRVIPLLIQAGITTSATAQGTTVAQHDATACTGAAVAQHDATPCTGGAVDAHSATGARVTGVTATGANTANTAPPFNGATPTSASAVHLAGTGMTAAGQVMTSTDNQNMALNEAAGMFLATATANSLLLIVSNTAVAGAPAVLTVLGTPVTDAGAYSILRGPTPAGTVGNHDHAAGAITVTDAGHDHAGPSNHAFTQPSTPILAHSVTQPNTPILAHTVGNPTHTHQE